MDSIEVPERYFCPNPLDDLTEEDIKDPYGGFKHFLKSGAVVVENGKPKWVKRSKNRFLQMYSVRFVKSKSSEDELKFDQICGKIIFDAYKIFERKPGSNPNAINGNGFTRLIGPMCPVYGWSRILLYPRFYRANRPCDFYHPDNPAGFKNKYLKGVMDCVDCLPRSDYVGICGKYILDPDFQDFKEQPSDALITEEIETSVGTVKYSYAILEDSVDSFLTIRLLEWNGPGPAPCVYGRICASNSKLPEAQSTIFDRRRDEAIPISRQQYIPIDRPVNIVSMGHYLELSVRIWHKNAESSKRDDLVIVTDSFGVLAQCVTFGRGEDGIIETVKIGDELCKFEVKVYFLPSWSTAFSDAEGDSDYDGW